MVKSDNGSEFKNIFHELCIGLGVEHRRSLPYHPQSNGIAERFVRTIKTYLTRFLYDKNK